MIFFALFWMTCVLWAGIDRIAVALEHISKGCGIK